MDKKNDELQSAPAVEHQNFAGDERCIDEEGDGGGDVFGCAGAVEWGPLDEIGCQIGWIAGHGDSSWSDGVDAVFWSERFGQAACEHADSCFGYAVGDVAGPAEEAGDVGKIDDDAVVFFQQRGGGLGTEKWGSQIHIERSIPDLLGDGCEVGVKKIRGVVDEDVEAAKFFIGVGEEFVDVGFFGQVGGQAYGATT